MGIALLLLFSLPLWKKMEEKQPVEEKMEILSLKQILQLKGAPVSLLVYVGSCGIEAIVLSYGTTFLTKSHGVSPSMAAEIITFYYLGITAGRFLSGVISGKFLSEQILIMGEAITVAAIVLMLLAPTPVVAGIALFLVGFGNGPVFPNMTHLVPIHYGKSKSQAFIGLQGAVAYVSFLLLPAVTGMLIRYVGPGSFPWILTGAMAVTGIATASLLRIHSDKLPKE
jgi:predicted MFS family arabinose efflux permease